MDFRPYDPTKPTMYTQHKRQKKPQEPKPLVLPEIEGENSFPPTAAQPGYYTALLENGPAGTQGFTSVNHEFREPLYYQGNPEQCVEGSDSGADGFQHAKFISHDTGQSQCSEVSMNLSDDRVPPPSSSPPHIGHKEPVQDCIRVAPSSQEWKNSTAESTFGQKSKRGGVTRGTPNRLTKRRAHTASASQPWRPSSHAPSEHPHSRAHAQKTSVAPPPAGSTRIPAPHQRRAPSVSRGNDSGQQAEESSLPGRPSSRLPLARPKTTQQQSASASRPQTAGSFRRRGPTPVIQRQKSDASCSRCGISADMMLRDTTSAISSEVFHQYLSRLLDDKLPREELVRLVSRTCCAFIHGHWLASRGSWTHSDPGDDLAFSDSVISLNPTGSSVNDSLSSARLGRSNLPSKFNHSDIQKQQKGVQKWTSLEEMRLQAYRREGKDWDFICTQFPHRTKGALQYRAHFLGC